MDKRFNQNTYNNLVNLVEKMTGGIIKERERYIITKGADEVDLVRSGLEETMINAYQQIRIIKKRRKKVDTLRTAAFLNALEKIGSDYTRLGIFP
jgi:glutamate dehydrogenase (NAD(P)+)